MGQEIAYSEFTRRDFERFGERLRRETAILHDWLLERRFTPVSGVAGFEIEAWLVDRAGQPAPLNQAFLERMADHIRYEIPPPEPELKARYEGLDTPVYGQAAVHHLR